MNYVYCISHWFMPLEGQKRMMRNARCSGPMRNFQCKLVPARHVPVVSQLESIVQIILEALEMKRNRLRTKSELGAPAMRDLIRWHAEDFFPQHATGIIACTN